jgi:hypothetical protein
MNLVLFTGLHSNSLTHVFLAYFPKMKEGLWNHHYSISFLWLLFTVTNSCFCLQGSDISNFDSLWIRHLVIQARVLLVPHVCSMNQINTLVQLLEYGHDFSLKLIWFTVATLLWGVLQFTDNFFRILRDNHNFRSRQKVYYHR